MISVSAVSPYVCAETFAQPNDHSHRQLSILGISIFTKSMTDGSVQAFYTLKHSFTNTLECDVRVSVPVSGPNGERFVQATLRNEYVFPEAAFPEVPHHYEIDISAGFLNGEALKPHYSIQAAEAASCRGFAPTKRLPQNVCKFLVKNHDEVCSYADGIGKYPVTRNGQFLGICGCP